MKKGFSFLVLCLFLSINFSIFGIEEVSALSATGDTCNNDSDCQSGFCYPNNDTGVLECRAEVNQSTSLLANGATCDNNNQCQSNFCGSISYINTNECQTYNPSTSPAQTGASPLNLSDVAGAVKGVAGTVSGAVNTVQGAANSATGGNNNSPANASLNNAQSAPAPKSYVLLEPLDMSGKGLPVNLNAGADGKSVTIGNNIGDVTSFIFVLLVSASLVAAVFMIMAGSFKRFTTDSIYKKTEGNEMIQRAIYGLLSVLFMYLIILFINPDMLRKGLNLPSYKSTSTPSVQAATTPYDSNPATNPASNTPRPYSPNPVLTDAVNRKKLTDVGIDTNHPGADCTPAQWQESVPSCTSLEGLPIETINMLLSLKNDCGGQVCGIIITGGTEPGHKTHGKGLYPVDLNCSVNGASCLSSTSRLNTYITTKLNKNNISISYCNNVYGPYSGGFFFCDENISKTGSGAPHWHVVGPS